MILKLCYIITYFSATNEPHRMGFHQDALKIKTVEVVLPQDFWPKKFGYHGNALSDKLILHIYTSGSFMYQLSFDLYKRTALGSSSIYNFFLQKCGCHGNALSDKLKTHLAHVSTPQGHHTHMYRVPCSPSVFLWWGYKEYLNLKLYKLYFINKI